MSKKTDAVKDADQDLVEVIVAARRSVIGHDGRAVGPGNPVKVPKGEVELLAARGFILGEGGELVPKGPATLAVS